MADEELEPGAEDETVEKTVASEAEPLEELREIDKEEDDDEELEIEPSQGPNKIVIGALGLVVFVALFVFFKGDDEPEDVVDLTINAPLEQKQDLDIAQVPSEELAREIPPSEPEPGEVMIVDEMPVEEKTDDGIQAISDEELNFFNPLEGSKEKQKKKAPAPKKMVKKSVATPAIPKVPQHFAEGLYSVQVGAFKDLASADKLVSSLEKRGFEAFVLNKGDQYFRVRVGNFQFKREARSLVAQIKSRAQLSSFVAAN